MLLKFAIARTLPARAGTQWPLRGHGRPAPCMSTIRTDRQRHFVGLLFIFQLTISYLRTALHARRLFARTNIARNGVSQFLFICVATDVVGLST